MGRGSNVQYPGDYTKQTKMVYYKNCFGFPTKSAVIISSFLVLIFYTLLVIFMTSICGITIYYGEKNPFRAQMDYFLGTDWNMMVVDLVFGLFWICHSIIVAIWNSKVKRSIYVTSFDFENVWFI